MRRGDNGADAPFFSVRTDVDVAKYLTLDLREIFRAVIASYNGLNQVRSDHKVGYQKGIKMRFKSSKNIHVRPIA